MSPALPYISSSNSVPLIFVFLYIYIYIPHRQQKRWVSYTPYFPKGSFFLPPLFCSIYLMFHLRDMPKGAYRPLQISPLYLWEDEARPVLFVIQCLVLFDIKYYSTSWNACIYWVGVHIYVYKCVGFFFFFKNAWFFNFFLWLSSKFLVFF